MTRSRACTAALSALILTLSACGTTTGGGTGLLNGVIGNDLGGLGGQDGSITSDDGSNGGADSSAQADAGSTSGKDTTTAGPVCGNGSCETGENAVSCPKDCTITPPTCKVYADVQPILSAKCGKCHAYADSCNAQDATTGAAITALTVLPTNMPPKSQPALTAAEKTAVNAWLASGAPCDASACTTSSPVCGNGTCEAGESAASCAKDCGTVSTPVCGNGKCETGETAASCPGDCGAVLTQCGNGVCETGETTASCPGDCPSAGAKCGNGVCEAGETAKSCPADCSVVTPTGNYCDTHCTVDQQPSGCYCDDQCSNYGDCCLADGSMPTSKNPNCTGTCGLCNGGGTTPTAVCGNGTCETGETTANCPKDCPAAGAVCGNAKCETGETATSCPADCGGTTTCKTTYSSVQAIFTSNCNGCHGHKFGTACSYTAGKLGTIKSYVQSGGMPTNKVMSASDKAAVIKWINDGGNCTIPGCP